VCKIIEHFKKSGYVLVSSLLFCCIFIWKWHANCYKILLALPFVLLVTFRKDVILSSK
jgi:hypothetical protein